MSANGYRPEKTSVEPSQTNQSAKKKVPAKTGPSDDTTNKSLVPSKDTAKALLDAAAVYSGKSMPSFLEVSSGENLRDDTVTSNLTETWQVPRSTGEYSGDHRNISIRS